MKKKIKETKTKINQVSVYNEQVTAVVTTAVEIKQFYSVPLFKKNHCTSTGLSYY